MSNRKLQVAIVGYGKFGAFVASSLAQSELVEVSAIADPTPNNIPPGVRTFSDFKELIQDPSIDAVHIATPPASHASLTLAALERGKHVVVEKPLALTPQDGQKIVASSMKNNRFVAVNYVMKHNPILQAVQKVGTLGLFGPMHYLRLENIAAQVKPDNHWFWDMVQSGGILLEHGVHFFDAASWLLGAAPQDTSGSVYLRNQKNTESTATVRYSNGVVGNFYHAFITERSLEKTDWLLVWEKAQIHIEGWIPLTALVTTVPDDQVLSALQQLGFTVVASTNGVLTAQMALPKGKQESYALAVQSVWENMAHAISENEPPQTDAESALSSLAVAWQASQNQVKL